MDCGGPGAGVRRRFHSFAAWTRDSGVSVAAAGRGAAADVDLDVGGDGGEEGAAAGARSTPAASKDSKIAHRAAAVIPLEHTLRGQPHRRRSSILVAAMRTKRSEKSRSRGQG